MAGDQSTPSCCRGVRPNASRGAEGGHAAGASSRAGGGSGAGTATVLLTATFAGMLVGALFWGWLADRVGRRNVFLVTVSLGEERIFRLSHPKTEDVRDFPATDGTVFVLPFGTNKVWKHEVPRFAHRRGRRTSITIGAFLT